MAASSVYWWLTQGVVVGKAIKLPPRLRLFAGSRGSSLQPSASQPRQPPSSPFLDIFPSDTVIRISIQMTWEQTVMQSTSSHRAT